MRRQQAQQHPRHAAPSAAPAPQRIAAASKQQIDFGVEERARRIAHLISQLIASRQIMHAANDIPDRSAQPQLQRFGMAQRRLQRVVVVAGDQLVRRGRRPGLDQHTPILAIEQQRLFKLVNRQRQIGAEEGQRSGPLGRQDNAGIAAIRQAIQLCAEGSGCGVRSAARKFWARSLPNASASVCSRQL